MKKRIEHLRWGGMVRLAGAALIAAVASAKPAAAEDTIKIAGLLIDAGPFASYVESQTNILKYAVDKVNEAGGVNGKKLEAVIITHAGSPDAAVQAATRAVRREGAKFVTGMFTSSISLALSARLPSMGAIAIDPFSQSDLLTGKNCSTNYFRVSTNDSMIMGGIKKFLVGTGVKRWDIIAVDYAAGHDAAEKFKAMVETHGGSIGKTLFAPLGTSDFGAQISQLANDRADGLFVTIFGSDAVNLAKQQAPFGLFKQYKVVLGNGFAGPTTLPGQGDSVQGVYQTLSYLPAFPGDMNAAFAKGYAARYGSEPSYNLADQYVGVMLLAEAMKKAGSSDVNAVKAALAGLKMNTVFGEVEMRAADHQLVRPIAMTQVTKDAAGKLGYTIKEIESGTTIIPPVAASCKM